MIEYLKEENKILREKLGPKRILLNDSQRRRLAILGKKVGRKMLTEVCSVFSPATIMKWHFKLVAKKYDGSVHRKKYGRPQITDELRNLIDEPKCADVVCDLSNRMLSWFLDTGDAVPFTWDKRSENEKVLEI